MFSTCFELEGSSSGRPSSWRWTFGLETCRKHKNIKISI